MALDQLSLKITFDETGAVKAVENLAKATGDAAGKIGDAGKKSASTLDAVSGSLKTFTDKIKNAFGELVVGFGSAYVNIKKAITAYEESEISITNLTNAFSKVVTNVDEATKSFTEFSKSQQEQTKYSDEAINNAGALFVQLNHLSGQALKDVTKATMDYATAQRIDLDTAARNVSQSIEGSRNAFQKFGLQLDAGLTPAQKMGEIMGFVNSKFEGFAEKEGKSAAGQMKIMKNMIDEVYESVGQNLVPALLPFIQIIINLAKGFGDLPKPLQMTMFGVYALVPAVLALNAAFGPIGLVVTGVVLAMTGLTALIYETAKAIGFLKEKNVESVKTDRDKIEANETLIKQYQADLDMMQKLKAAEQANNLVDEEIIETKKELAKLRKENNELMKKEGIIVEDNTKLTEAERKQVEELTQTYTSDTDKKIQAIDKLLNSHRASSAEIIALEDMKRALLNQRDMDNKAAQLERENTQFSELTALYQNDLISKGEYLAQVDTLFSDSAQKRKDAQDAVLQKEVEIAAQSVGYATGYASSINSIQQGLTQGKINEINRFAEHDKKVMEDRFKNGLITEQQMKDSISAIDKKAKKEVAKRQRDAAIVEKTASIFSIIANTGIAVAKAFAANPLSFGLPWSAAAIAAGALQTAAVLAQPLPEIPAFAMGGTVGGYGGIDSQLVKATPGETMLNPSQSQNLFNNLQSAGLLGTSNGNNITNNNVTNNNDRGMRYNFNAPIYVTGDKSFEKEVSGRLSTGGDFL